MWMSNPSPSGGEEDAHPQTHTYTFTHSEKRLWVGGRGRKGGSNPMNSLRESSVSTATILFIQRSAFHVWKNAFMELEQTKLISALLNRAYGKTHKRLCTHKLWLDFVNSDVLKRSMLKQEMELICILSNQDTCN